MHWRNLLWRHPPNHYLTTQYIIFTKIDLNKFEVNEYILSNKSINKKFIIFTIDFSIIAWTTHGRLVYTPPVRSKLHRTKLMKIYWYGHPNQDNSSNFKETILKFSEKFNHPFSQVFIFCYMFQRGTVSSLCRSQHRTTSSPFTNLGKIGTCFFETACNRHSSETVTLRKLVPKYKNMWKWMVEFFRKNESRGIKIANLNSILVTKSINFTLTLYGFVVRCDRGRFLVNSPFIEKSVFTLSTWI